MKTYIYRYIYNKSQARYVQLVLTFYSLIVVLKANACECEHRAQNTKVQYCFYFIFFVYFLAKKEPWNEHDKYTAHMNASHRIFIRITFDTPSELC